MKSETLEGLGSCRQAFDPDGPGLLALDSSRDCFGAQRPKRRKLHIVASPSLGLPCRSAPNSNAILPACPKAVPSYPPDRKGQERGMSFPKKGKFFPKPDGDGSSDFILDDQAFAMKLLRR